MPLRDQQPRKRIEYRGENLRISRTSGVSATKTIAKDGYGATLNTKHGVRLHKRLFKGARMGFQNGNFQLIGRYKSGPFNFNVSKSGVSTSIKNKRGSYNLLKPNYSSFKMGGVQVRGKNAGALQLIFMFFQLIFGLIKLGWSITVNLLWLILLVIKWFIDFGIGFYSGFRDKKLTAPKQD